MKLYVIRPRTIGPDLYIEENSLDMAAKKFAALLGYLIVVNECTRDDKGIPYRVLTLGNDKQWIIFEYGEVELRK